MRYLTLIFLLVFILSGCATTTLPPVTSKGFTLEEDEERLWRRSEEEQRVLDNSGLLYKDKELESYLNEVARRLQPPEVFERIPFRIKVLKNPYLNAFAFPNGVIYLHTGILARMENEAQLATLLAHEMTHATHRHAVKGFRDIKNKSAFLATIQVTLGGLGGGVGDIVTLLGAVGTLAAVTGYSRELETEADIEGLRLMVNAGYDPKEAPKLFIHLKKELEEEDIKEPFFFGTHPRLRERIRNYENLLKTKYEGHSGGIKNSRLFMEKIQRLILDNARLDLKAGRFKTAQRGIERYLKLRPDDPDAYYLLGEVFRQRGKEGDIEKAKEYYEKAINIDSSYPEPHKGIGLIFYKKGKKDNAKKHLELYLSLSPEAPDRAYIEEYIKTLSD
jgi:predicted Zn-dependent protease